MRLGMFVEFELNDIRFMSSWPIAEATATENRHAIQGYYEVKPSKLTTT